jgi:ectoine hydroxylase-related dioxygenase (phytanoyl-CoA dioxygenase family)
VAEYFPPGTALLPASAERLTDDGFVVLPGPDVQGGVEQLQAAYDAAVLAADPADVRIGSSTRVADFVNRSQEFDGVYIHPPLLEAAQLVIGRPFKLSNTCARTLVPGTQAQKLHADVKYEADGWPLVGYIWMIDAFSNENGATSFVPGSHRRHRAPGDCYGDGDGEVNIEMAEIVSACGTAGSLIVFNASVWHGHAANRSAQPRRSVQGHFVPREAAGAIDYRARMRPDTLGRIGELARYLLDL